MNAYKGNIYIYFSRHTEELQQHLLFHFEFLYYVLSPLDKLGEHTLKAK